MINEKYSVYTGSPISTNQEFSNISGMKQSSRTVYEESEAARLARQKLYGRRKPEDRPRVLSASQKKKLAKEQVLDTLTDSTIIDPTKVTDVMASWATDDLGVDDQVSQRIFAQSLVTTQSIPNKNVFRIRIKL